MGIAISSNSGPVDAKFITFVQEVVAKYPVVVFSKSSCPYCSLAKDVLSKASPSVPAHIIELNQIQDGYEIQRALYEITKISTVPNVFIGGVSIGGGTDTKALHLANKLIPLIEKASERARL